MKVYSEFRIGHLNPIFSLLISQGHKIQVSQSVMAELSGWMSLKTDILDE